MGIILDGNDPGWNYPSTHRPPLCHQSPRFRLTNKYVENVDIGYDGDDGGPSRCPVVYVHVFDLALAVARNGSLAVGHSTIFSVKKNKPNHPELIFNDIPVARQDRTKHLGIPRYQAQLLQAHKGSDH